MLGRSASQCSSARLEANVFGGLSKFNAMCSGMNRATIWQRTSSGFPNSALRYKMSLAGWRWFRTSALVSIGTQQNCSAETTNASFRHRDQPGRILALSARRPMDSDGTAQAGVLNASIRQRDERTAIGSRCISAVRRAIVAGVSAPQIRVEILTFENGPNANTTREHVLQALEAEALDASSSKSPLRLRPSHTAAVRWFAVGPSERPRRRKRRRTARCVSAHVPDLP